MGSDEEDVPRIGRGRIVARFPLGHVVKILMLITALVAVIAMRNGCAQGVASWFNVVAPSVGGDGGPAR